MPSESPGLFEISLLYVQSFRQQPVVPSKYSIPQIQGKKVV